MIHSFEGSNRTNHSGCSARNHRCRILLATLVDARPGNPMETNSTGTHTHAHPSWKEPFGCHSPDDTYHIHSSFYRSTYPDELEETHDLHKTIRYPSCVLDLAFTILVLLIHYNHIQHSQRNHPIFSLCLCLSINNGYEQL
jgi:hypothetical protein